MSCNQPQCDGALLPVGHVAAIMQDYVHPREVLRDDRLDSTEKRAILCFWASDVCAVDSRPGFRWLPGTPGPILFDHVMAALQSLDSGSSVNRTEQSCMSTPRHVTQPVHAGA